ncbi:MAG: hypothetical protein JNN28_03790 [Saprospiraceae bacterium]|nr:hypothetical protein [Saprospiraceae bacterium]
MSRKYGFHTLRTGLFHHVLNQWGYEGKKEALQYFKQLGFVDIVGIIGYPAPESQDSTKSCSGQVSTVFKGLYLPIWEQHSNETLINQENTFAAYVWEVANSFKGLVSIYEVWNEPDAGNGGLPKGLPGNWWDAPPPPCQTGLNASVFTYVRMLRITYEVLKKVDPNALVATGGLGWPAYLDAICRYTDQPLTGKISSDSFPLTGGAYFDCVSFHAYPHLFTKPISGSKNKDAASSLYSNAALEGLWGLKNQLNQVLLNHGFDGIKYPEKRWICTEFNLPREPSKSWSGDESTQLDFVVKALASAPANKVNQMHLYALSDGRNQHPATPEFDAMGMFEALDTTRLSKPKPHAIALAIKHFEELLNGYAFDPDPKAQPELPSWLEGSIFKDKAGKEAIVLWLKNPTESETPLFYMPQQWASQRWTLYPIGSAHYRSPDLIKDGVIPMPPYPILLLSHPSW